jgi:predicted nucleotidyltransferase
MLSLRSKITQKILGHLVLHEGEEMYLNQMCQRFNVDRGNLVRKLKELEDKGVLKSQWRGNQHYYRLNPDFPLIKEYKKIILKTVGLEVSLKEVLHLVGGIEKAFLFGSYAKDKMDLSSDIDLLVLGDHNTIELQRQIAKFQKEIDREINVISISPDEYERKKENDPFLQAILKKKKVMIL